MEPPESTKKWEDAWSFQDIEGNADNWNLACDAALLNTLKSFAKSVISKATEVDDKLNALCNELEETQINFELVQNEFNGLKNTQFVECRVYEDDETAEEDKSKSVTEKTDDAKDAVERGIELVDKYYERIEVDVSDSEDEIDQPDFVLKLKDLYADRPLGYTIGSKEWYEKWHVGLVESSDSEPNEEPEEFSDSSSENTDTRSEVIHSDASSELNDPYGVDTASDTRQAETAPITEPTRLSFAEQLAQKLGNVILDEPEINRRPIQKPASDYHPVVSDEPPPLETKSELFSGGKGIFDDDNEDMWYQPDKPTIKAEPTIPGKSIFESSDSDDDIFSSKYQKTQEAMMKRPYLEESKHAPFLSEEPPSLESSIEKKKPTGAVSIFGSDIFEGKIGSLMKNRRKDSSDESSSKSNTPKDRDNDDKPTLFEDNLTPKREDEIFDDLFNAEKPAIFEGKIGNLMKNRRKDSSDESSSESVTTKPSLFEDNSKPKDEIFDDLFNSEKPKPVKKVNFDLFNEKRSDLFEDDKPKPDDTKSNLFDDDPFGDDLFADIDKKFTSSLFKTEDLFGEAEAGASLSDPVPTTSSPSVIRYVDTTPPPDDFDDTDVFDDTLNPLNAGIIEFDNTGPLSLIVHDLDSGMISRTSDSSRDVSEQRSRMDTTYSFHPVLSSSRRFSSDHYQEDDSLYFTKNSLRDSSNRIIEEPPSEASITKDYLEITPSGIEADLYSSRSVGEEENNTLQKVPEKIVKEISTDKSDDKRPSQNSSSEDLDMAKRAVSSKIAGLAEKLQSSAGAGENKNDRPNNAGLPGKLTNRNLNINIGALLPGAAPPRKISSPDTAIEKRAEPDETDFKRTVSIPIIHPPEKSAQIERSASFEDAPAHEVLESVTKERVRAPVKRRPSSRRARQQSLRNSVSEFRLKSEAQAISDNETPETDNPVHNDILAPKQDDLFESIAKDQSNSIDILDDLFTNVADKPNDTRADLFESSLKPEPKQSGDKVKTKKVNLFDSDSDEDFLSSIGSAKTVVSTNSSKSKAKLFEDDDDDDLFSTKSTSGITSSKSDTKVAKTAKIKLENRPIDDDPLSALLK